MLDKSKIDKELARRLSAAFISNQMGVSISTQYKKTPEDVGDLCYFLAALADKLAREGQEGVYRDWGAWLRRSFNRNLSITSMRLVDDRSWLGALLRVSLCPEPFLIRRNLT